MDVLIATVLLALLWTVGWLLALAWKKHSKGTTLKDLDMSLFLVMMPEYEQKDADGRQKDEKELIGAMEQIYAHFLSLKRPGIFERFFSGAPRVAFEIASQTGGSDIEFYVAVPVALEQGFEKYVQGIYPKAIIEKVARDYTIFEPANAVAASALTLATPLLSLNTYRSMDKDPLAATTNALSRIAENEGAAIQIVIRPFNQDQWRGIGSKLISKVKEGVPLKMAMAQSLRSPFEEIVSEILFMIFRGAKQKEEKEEEEKQKFQVDENVLKSIGAKIQKQIFLANVRLVASAPSPQRAQEVLEHLESAFGQFSLLSFNHLETTRVPRRSMKQFLRAFIFRTFAAGTGMILNVEELASLFHFPTHLTKTPYIKSSKTSEEPPPAELPDEGPVLLGGVTFRGEEKPVYAASREDRRRHMYVVGQTGTGKSSLFREMIRQDIEHGEGVGVIDPHGELVEYTLQNIPKERAEDVVLFEPFDLERPLGLNMLEHDTPQQKDFAVQEMIAIFYKLFPPEIIGPMFEHYMRNAMLVLMADQAHPGTLVEIPRMFTDEAFLDKKLESVSDPIVRSFWTKEWKQTTGSTKSDMLGYVVSKVGRFIENEMMRNIVGQERSGFKIEDIMDSGKIFLANLSKGRTGEVNSSLLGLILVSKIQMAAMKRARTADEHQRRDFYLYIDEFQNFTTDSISTILSEARKYHLNLLMAHQYIPQLTQEIRNAVIGNVGTIASYRVGADDAEFLEKQFEPAFSRFDLLNLDNFTLVVKMLIQNKVSSPFKMRAYPPKEGNKEMVAPIRSLSRLQYGKPRAEVEQEIFRRFQHGE